MSIPKEKYQKSLEANLRRFTGEFRSLQREIKFAMERHATGAQIIPGGDTFEDYLEWGNKVDDAVEPMLAAIENSVKGTRERIVEIGRHARDVADAAIAEHGGSGGDE